LINLLSINLLSPYNLPSGYPEEIIKASELQYLHAKFIAISIVEYPAMGDVVRSKEKKYYRAVYLQRANDSRKKKEPNKRLLLQ